MNQEIFLQMLENIKAMNDMMADGENLNDVFITISLINSDKVHAEYGNIKVRDNHISFWSNRTSSFECIPYSSIVRISC